MATADTISAARPQGTAQGMGPATRRDSHQTSTKVTTQLKDIEKTLPLRVLSKQDFAFWQQNGYVIVRNAVPADNVERLKALLWEFEEKDPTDPSTWYAEVAAPQRNPSGKEKAFVIVRASPVRLYLSPGRPER